MTSPSLHSRWKKSSSQSEMIAYMHTNTNEGKITLIYFFVAVCSLLWIKNFYFHIGRIKWHESDMRETHTVLDFWINFSVIEKLNYQKNCDWTLSWNCIKKIIMNLHPNNSKKSPQGHSPSAIFYSKTISWQILSGNFFIAESLKILIDFFVFILSQVLIMSSTLHWCEAT